ncbi:hypothetical protein BELL_0079g00050 [Botrytis elliptica]|uniref:Uncharacterized protein n=1 Tax=Botrytis elliptica TaxID=278938 RepID=A0A4Z1K9L1_9HELO|nr:hypothetical protein BELL_0079g00050 [Botrytis elliptica]
MLSAVKKLHIRMRIYDSRRRTRENPRLRAHVWFFDGCLFQRYEMRRDILERFAERVDFDEFFVLLVGLGDDPFAHVLVRDVVLGAEGIEHLTTTNAYFGFEGIGTVIKTRVDDLMDSSSAE